MRMCRKCRRVLELKLFPLQTYYIESADKCHDCHYEYNLALMINDPDIYYNPVISAAQDFTRRLINAGAITLTGTCFGCGNPATNIHHNNYRRPDDITEFCKHCHDKFHNCLSRIYRATGVYPEHYKCNYRRKRDCGTMKPRKNTVPLNTHYLPLYGKKKRRGYNRTKSLTCELRANSHPG